MSSQDPEEIRAEIERTRAHLSNNVDQIGRTVSPSNVVQRQKDKARGAISDLKDRVMGSDDDDRYYGSTYRTGDDESRLAGAQQRLHEAGDSLATARDQAGQAISNAPQNIRRQAQGNPFAAGLVAFGVGALAASLIPSSQREQRFVERAGEKAQPLLDQAQEAAKGLAEDIKPAVQDAVSGAVSEVKATAQEGVENVKAQGQEAAANVKDGAADAKDNVQAQRKN